jgi:hypothetical protein
LGPEHHALAIASAFELPRRQSWLGLHFRRFSLAKVLTKFSITEFQRGQLLRLIWVRLGLMGMPLRGRIEQLTSHVPGLPANARAPE